MSLASAGAPARPVADVRAPLPTLQKLPQLAASVMCNLACKDAARAGNESLAVAELDAIRQVLEEASLLDAEREADHACLGRDPRRDRGEGIDMHGAMKDLLRDLGAYACGEDLSPLTLKRQQGRRAGRPSCVGASRLS
jgi:hypothetical protein